MGDIIKTLSTIGTHYLEDEKRVKNKAYEYTKIKVYLCDIETKQIEPYTTIKNEDLIITRFGVGANSGNLFPNMFFEPKNVKKEFDKFVRGTLKANKNLLSCFKDEEIEKDVILKTLLSIDESFFADEDKIEEIQGLSKYEKAKGEKGKFTTYFALSYQDRPISYYFKEIYEKHLNSFSEATMRGYDIVSNQEGIGGDANLAFCSTNELPTKLKPIKLKLLPLSFDSAKKVKIGFDVMDKLLSHNFYGLKMAIMPTLLSDEVEYKDVLEILEKSAKGEMFEIRESETTINDYLEDTAYGEKGLPVLNTILFYAKNNSAVDVLLQIDDVLPSYISYVSDKMGEYNIKAFKNKDVKDSQETIYIQNIFSDRLEIMSILLSSSKIEKDILIYKFSQLIYWGTMNKSYAYPVEWGKYFNGHYANRSIESISRYLALFRDTKKLKENFILEKEIDLEEIKDKKQMIEKLIESSEFLNYKENQKDVLKTAYTLGMLSSALINRQYAISKSDSYSKWLNNRGAIRKEILNKIWDKSESIIKRLDSVNSGRKSFIIEIIREFVIESSQKAFIYDGIVKSSFVSLAFAMGGSDYTKYIKETKKEEK